jgi:hypothetical protein
MIDLRGALVYDIEGDNLYPEITKVHCVSCINYQQQVITFTDVPSFLEHLKGVKPSILACHNQFGYDLHVLKKFGVFDFSVEQSRVFDFKCWILDTLSLSRRLNPDRQLPRGCPPKVYNVTTGRYDSIGAHSLAAWAYRTGGTKPQVTDWSTQPLEVYIDRCEEDVKNNWLALEMLNKEIKG